MAYAKMNKHKEAEEAYQNALRLDPDNADYQNNLNVTQQRLAEMANAPAAGVGANAGVNAAAAAGGLGAGLGEGLPNFGGMDFAAAFNNPALINLATQMMSNPAMQDTLTQLRSQIHGMNNMNGIFDV